MAISGMNYEFGLGTVQRYSKHYQQSADDAAVLATKKAKKPKKLKKAVRKSKRRAPAVIIRPEGGMGHC